MNHRFMRCIPQAGKIEEMREREREYNKVQDQACFIGNFLLEIFTLKGFVKACPVSLTDSYKTDLYTYV